MRVSALYLTFVLLSFFGSVIASARDSEISIREIEEKLEEAVRLHNERKFALADDVYTDLLAALVVRQTVISADLFEDYILSYIH